MTDAKKIAEEILEAWRNWIDAAAGDEQRTWEAFVSASHLRDSSALARAYLDVLELVADLRNERDAYRDAVAATKAAYPESVFRPESESKDAESARWARMVCDNISRRAEENMSEATDE